jgi:hypothetical protein
MGRLRLGAFTAFTLVALAGPARAAEITRITSRGEPGNPFDLHVTLRWDRLEEGARITRETPSNPTPENPAGGIADGDEMRYTRTVNAVVPRVAVGITEDLEIHFEWPYVLGDDHAWRFGLVGGVPAGGVPPYSTIETNEVDAQGQTCPVDLNGSVPGLCPLFPVAPETTTYHGGRAGDLMGGLAWGIFDEKEDPTKPFWLVGLDVTFPTAALYDPAANRGTAWSSPHNVPGKPGPFGQKVWKWDLYTVLSRRMGPIDPYVKAHATLMSRSSATYSNCDHAAELAARTPREMTSVAAANCAAGGSDARADLPWIAGLTFGTELVPYEDEPEQQKVSIDLRVFADYTSSQRFYNELTDASGRLHQTEEYLTVGGFLGLYLRASRYVSLNATASLSTATPHFLTGESLGRNGSWPALDATGNGLTADPAAMNPNYDWRYDAPGRRFRISEVSNFTLSFGGVLTF